MTPTTETVKPGIPEEATKAKPRLFTLTYRQGINPHPMMKNFEFIGDIHDAVRRAKRHCEVMNMVFIRVTPFIADLDFEERRTLDA